MFAARALATTARTATRAASRASQSSAAPRAFFSAAAKRLADDHHAPAPPTLIAEGAPSGAVPSDENQATGLERLQLLGALDGIDVFDMQALEVTRLGTKQDPILVKSYGPERQVGCTGFPVDSHDTIWLSLTKEKEIHRCPECGSAYKLDFQGLEEAHGHHH